MPASDPDSSVFAGGPLPPPLTKAQEARKKVRDKKWNAVAHLRDAMSAEEREIEERRIRAEIVEWERQRDAA